MLVAFAQAFILRVFFVVTVVNIAIPVGHVAQRQKGLAFGRVIYQTILRQQSEIFAKVNGEIKRAGCPSILRIGALLPGWSRLRGKGAARWI